MWLVKCSLRLKLLPHISQRKGVSLVWERIWLAKCSLRVYFLPQTSHWWGVWPKIVDDHDDVSWKHKRENIRTYKFIYMYIEDITKWKLFRRIFLFSNIRGKCGYGCTYGMKRNGAKYTDFLWDGGRTE